MTSANLSLGEKIKTRKKYVTRTLWISLVSLPFLAAYYVLGIILMITRAINYGEMYGQKPDYLFHEKLCAVTKIMGFEGFGWMLIALMAVLFAFQGFGYIFNQSQIDFYLSQPTTRSKRIRNNYFNAFSTFISMYLVVELIAIIIASIFGAMNTAVLVTILIETLRNIVLFFTVYNVTVLAMFLSGTMPIAVLMTAFFAFVTIVFSAEKTGLKDIFFATYTSEEGWRAYLSPIYDRFMGMYQMGGIYSVREYNMSISYALEIYKSLFKFDLDTLILGVIALVFVVITSRLRKSEDAGRTLVFKPFRWILKVIICVASGIGAGILVYYIYNYTWSNTFFMLMCLVMVIACLLMGSLTEIIFDNNIKSFFRGKAQTIMAAAIVLLVFFVFRGDLIGYDSYLPRASSVKSCAIITNSYEYQFYDGRSNVFDNYAKNNMYLTDVQDVLSIAKVGMENKRKHRNQEYYDDYGYDVTVLYRLNDGREIYREITIPIDCDAEVMDRITHSEEYIRGRYACFGDDYVRGLIQKNPDNSLEYDCGFDSVYVKNVPYDELCEAYKKDALEHYSYTYLHDNNAIGEISYQMSGDRYGRLSFTVYKDYTNTIAFLKKYDAFIDNTINTESIRKLTVTNYYPGIDIDSLNPGEIYHIDVDSYSQVYTDPKQQEEIMNSAIFTNGYSEWSDWGNVDGKYSIEIEVNSSHNGGTTYTYASFYKGQVPDFVIKDTDN